jgi:hypothetical protein
MVRKKPPYSALANNDGLFPTIPDGEELEEDPPPLMFADSDDESDSSDPTSQTSSVMTLTFQR